MEQKSVLITGCSSGIGRCVAHGLRQCGYRVFATARRQQDVEGLLAEQFESFQLDVANSASIRAAVDMVIEKTNGRLYGLFNNAGYGQPGAVEDLSRDMLREQFETNLFGLHELTALLLPFMRKQGSGRIIQNSSVLGLVAMKYRGAYIASKFALEGLTDTLRMELDNTDIHVSLIEPGPIKSAFRRNAYSAFRKNIDSKSSPHAVVYEGVERRLSSLEEVPFTLGAEAVLKRVIHALESDRPKARYYVTLPTYGLGFLKRILPTRVMDRLLLRLSGAENQ